jgi:hypothetical protein
MLDIHTRESAGRRPSVIQGVDFLRMELSPQMDGKVLVSLTATIVDEQEPQLLDQEVAFERVETVDDVLALIRAHVRIGRPEPPILLSVAKETT